jgi:predicted outer membrane repeat protein
MRRAAITGCGAAASVVCALISLTPPASAQPVQVPCDPAALAAALAAQEPFSTISLAPRCTYDLTAPLPPVTTVQLQIDGNYATLLRSSAAGTPQFPLLTDTAGALAVDDLNFAHGDGAIYQTGGGGLVVQGGTFNGNETAGNGGAIYSAGPQMGALDIYDATFTGNTAAGAGGAVYYWAPPSQLIITGCRYEGNQAGTDGGSVYAADIGTTITQTTVTASRAARDGGGLYVPNPGLLTSDMIAGDTAGQDGGGVFEGMPDAPAIWTSVIEDNTAGLDGGGVYDNAVSNTLYFESWLAGNTAAGDGGGIWAAGAPQIEDDQVTGNTAAGGGGIFAAQPQLVTLDGGTAVTGNQPDNCEPAGTVVGCTG